MIPLPPKTFAALLLALVGAPTIAFAHTNSVGYVNSGNGSVTFWYGNWHIGTNFNEGSITVQGVNGTTYGPTTVPFTLLQNSLPTGLVLGTNYFFSDGTQLISYVPRASTSWQGATFTGLQNGSYRFTYTPAAQPTQEWEPADNVLLSATLTVNPPAAVTTVTAISPSSGPLAGGQSVTITGTDFTGATAVTIGGTAATNVTVVNATTITATTPAGAAGTASVLVTTPGGTNSANTLYTFGAPDLSVNISNAPNPLSAGTPGSLSLTVTNVGTLAHSGLVGATLTVPAGWGEVSANGTGWNCNAAVAGTNLSCSRSDALAAGSSYPVITLSGTVPRNAAASLTATGSVTGNGETNLSNNNTTATIQVRLNRSLGSFSCVSNAGVPPIVRAEGMAELVGDLVLNCTGGVPTPAGETVPQANVQIFLNTNITSRLTSDPWSEAMLMIDEPGTAAQRYCSQNGGCSVTGVGSNIAGNDGIADGVDYDAASGSAPNVFQGRQAGTNSIVWLGVPIDPPGELGTRVIRITNIRANANQLGVSSTLIPTQIVMFVSVTGTTSVPINNPQQTVAFIQPGLSFSTRQAVNSYLQCVSFNSAAATDSSKALINGMGTIVRFAEGFASSFKRRNAAAYVDGDTSPTPVNQNVPGAIYNTESGFLNQTPAIVSGSSANGLAAAGLADHGTRLMARFANVPAGVALYASLYPVSTCSDCGTSSRPAITSVRAATSSTLTMARLITTDVNGGGSFSRVTGTNTSSFDSGAATAPIALNNGAGMAVWEVLQADPLTSQTYEFGIGVSYVANTSNNLPGLGSATVAGNFAPLSTVTTQSASAPLPRFADTSSARTIFTISACTTNLLFVFLSNQEGFDSGVAISNTSVDPLGTGAQGGPRKLNYFGETAGGGAAPAAQTSAVVPAGKQLTAVLSTGGNYGIAATPGFQGYMIAQCQFQYAHGFAFISDVGSNRVSEAYQGLILDSGLSSRTLFSSETLGH